MTTIIQYGGSTIDPLFYIANARSVMQTVKQQHQNSFSIKKANLSNQQLHPSYQIFLFLLSVFIDLNIHIKYKKAGDSLVQENMMGASEIKEMIIAGWHSDKNIFIIDTSTI